MSNLSYLASPYSHKSSLVKLWRFIQITCVAAKLHQTGQYTLITPITSSALQAWIGGLKGTWNTWASIDLEYIRNCKEILVCTMPGWRTSIGVTAEIIFAKEIGIPVKYINPKTLEITKEA